MKACCQKSVSSHSTTTKGNQDEREKHDVSIKPRNRLLPMLYQIE